MGSTFELHDSSLENAVLDLSPSLFIKLGLHCGRLALLHNSKILSVNILIMIFLLISINSFN